MDDDSTPLEPLPDPTPPSPPPLTEPDISHHLDFGRVKYLCLSLLSSLLFISAVSLPGLQNVSPLELASILASLMLCLLCVTLTHGGATVTLPRESLRSIAVFCLLAVVGVVATLYSLSGLPSPDTLLIFYLTPMFGVLASKGLLRQKVGVVNFSCCFGCVLGMVFVFQPRAIFSPDHRGSSPTKNILIALLGSFSLGSSLATVKTIGRRVSAVACAFWLCMAIAPTGLAAALILSTGPIIPPCGVERAEIAAGGVLLLLSLLLGLHCLARDPNSTALILMRFADVLMLFVGQVLIVGRTVDFLAGMGLVMVGGAVAAVFLHRLLKNVRLVRTPYRHLDETGADETAL